jgi:hypothetical protein
MTLINGPHDGDHAPGPAHGQIGLLTPLSPGGASLKEGEPCAWYIHVCGLWYFHRFVERGWNRKEWERLTFGRKATA